MKAAGQGHIARMLSAAEVPVLLLLPAVLVACVFLQADQSAAIAFGAAVAGLVLFFLIFELSAPGLRQIMPGIVLAAVAAAGRLLFAPIPYFKPVAAVCIIAGVTFGRRSGFMVGALSMLVSNFFFGQGMWTPWQMYAFGLIGYLAGVLGDCGAFRRKPAILLFGALAPFLFGLVMNTWTVVGFVHPISWETALLAYALGLQADAVHAVATVVFLGALYAPWTRKLERIKAKYRLAAGEQENRQAG